MSSVEIPTSDITSDMTLINYVLQNDFPGDPFFGNTDNVAQVITISDINELKDGFEPTVYAGLSVFPKPSSEIYEPEYEPISDDESTDSMSSMYNNLPNNIADWNSDHIMKWILDLYDSEDYRYEDLNLHHFNKRDGKYLMLLTEADWENIDKKRSKWLYESVQKLIKQSSKNSSTSSYETAPTIIATNSSEDEIDPNPPRRRRGRPRKLTAKRRPEQKIGRVWEFLRNLLKNPEYCPNLIYWEDYQTKKFRLVDGQKVAELWGKRKNNPNMTYEKFSRTIRHYYKDEVIISVPKEKLVYRFGVNAKGIETDNPNFGKPVNLR